MALVLKDRVRETSTTSGTGTLTLGGAVNGYQAFSVIGDGNTTYYAVSDPATGDWEVGLGTYTLSGTTLARTTVLESSNSGNLVNFGSGSKDVFITYPAEKAIYEEANGNVLIDGGPITVVGNNVTSYTTFSAALGEMYANVNSFAQMYAQNYSDGAEASGDFVVYRDDALNDTSKFVDMGINSSNYSSASYPIFTPGSAYLFNDGAELFVGSATDDLVLFAGGVDTTDEAARFDKTTKALTTVGDVNVGAALDVTGAATFGSTVTLNADPSTNLEAATKQYVDNVASLGIIIHPAVRVESIGNLNATYSNGTLGVGATLTNAGTQAALELDGIAVSVNDRVLVMDQTTQTQNGVYTVTDVGSGSTNWVLTRATDADSYGVADPNQLAQGSYFYIQEGDTAAGESYVCSTVGAIVFGTTAITFSQFSASPAYTGTAPIDVTGQVISLSGAVPATNGGTGTTTVTTGDLLYGSGTNTWAKLGIGSAYKSLVVNGAGTNVEWNAIALNQSGAVSGALPATNGGTGQTAYAVGDILYSGLADTLSKLSGNTTTTKKFLTQTGTGSASAAPAWDVVSPSDISGLGTMASQNANAVAITGGTLSGVAISGASTIDNSAIGGTTPAAVRGTTMEASNGIMANATTVTADYSLPANYNALSAGPVSVAPGVTVTIPTGSVWTVV